MGSPERRIALSVRVVMLIVMRERPGLGGSAQRALTLAVVIVAVCAAIGAAQAPARVALQTTVCGVGNGSTWTRAGASGRDWLVTALDDKNQCKSARQWLTQLSARITARTGADTQAFRMLGYACVMTKSQLLAACRTGNGGPGSAGVAVIGDPTGNPAARPYTNGATSFPALPSGSGSGSGPGAEADGIPVPGSGADCNLPVSGTAARWSFRLPTGTLMSGIKWTVASSPAGSEAGCRAFRDLWPELAAAAGSATANTDSFEAKSWIKGSWSCVASHDVAAPGGGSSISSVPTASCARIEFPGGGEHGILEQVTVYPHVESATTPITSAETTALIRRIIDLRDGIARYGIHLATVRALTAERLSAPRPGGHRAAGTHPLSDNAVFVCGSTPSEHDPSYRILGAAWTHGSEHGSNWQVAVDSGYPCQLARGLFLPFLAGILSGGSSPPAAQLNRYGWHCTLQRAALIGVCHLTARGNPLADAVGKPIPTNVTIGIRAAYVTGATRETLPNAVRAAS